VVLAATPTLLLDWNAPATCPDRASLLSEIQRLHEDVIPGDATGLVARATARELRGRWEVVVETRLGGAAGLRRLTADSCASAAQATAIVVSLALTHPPVAAPQPPLVGAPAPAQSPAVTTAAEPELALPATRHTKLALALAATVRSGPLPQFAPGAALSIGVWHRGVQVELTGFTPASQRVTAGRGHAQLELPVSAELGGSLPVFEGPIELDVALDVVGGWAHGYTEDIVVPRSGDTAWLAIEAGGALRFSVGGGLWARIDAHIGASVLRPRFQVDFGAGPQDIFETSVFSARGSIGIEWLF
jgi:hypothetical protein